MICFKRSPLLLNIILAAREQKGDYEAINPNIIKYLIF